MRLALFAACSAMIISGCVHQTDGKHLYERLELVTVVCSTGFVQGATIMKEGDNDIDVEFECQSSEAIDEMMVDGLLRGPILSIP